MAEHSGKFIAIGDIHGCPVQLEEILQAAEAYPDHRPVFLGDYIDRGPDSEAVIRRIRDLDAVFIFGNHEDMLLKHLGNENPEIHENPYLNLRLSGESIQWLRTVPVAFHRTGEYLFSHAGLDPEKSLESQEPRDYYWSTPSGSYSHITDATVVHGHLGVPVPEIEGNRINVNTGCGNRGYLSAVVLPEMVFLRSSESPGHETDWSHLRELLEKELASMDEVPELLEEVDDPEISG